MGDDIGSGSVSFCLQCFKKSSPSVMHSAASEMGRFIFKLKLTEPRNPIVFTILEFTVCQENYSDLGNGEGVQMLQEIITISDAFSSLQNGEIHLQIEADRGKYPRNPTVCTLREFQNCF